MSVYCTRRIPVIHQLPEHLRCIQCSILLHLINICILLCIYLWQISQIQACLCVVVRPRFVSTSPAFMRNNASHPADPHGQVATKTVNRAPIAGGERFRHHLHNSLQNCCDSSTTCRMCRLGILPHLICHTLAQLRTNKSPLLKSYLHKVDAKSHPSTLCRLCNTQHTSSLELHPHTHYVVTTGFVDRPHWSDGTAGQMDGKTDWCTTSGKIGFPR